MTSLAKRRILLGTQALVSLRAETPCRLARLDRQQFQNLIRDSKEASAMILQTMNDRLMRVQKYTAAAPSSRVLILGTKYDTDCRDIRGFLAANRIPYEFVDREQEPERVPAFLPKDLGCPAVTIDGKLFDHAPTCARSGRGLTAADKTEQRQLRRGHRRSRPGRHGRRGVWRLRGS